MSLPRLTALLFLAVFVSAPVRADEVSDLLKAARANAAKDTAQPISVPVARSPAPAPETPAASAAASCTDGIASAVHGKFCKGVDDCTTFCSCACQFDPHKWRNDVKNDGSTTCPGITETGEGMLPADSPELITVVSLPYVSVPVGTKATQEAADGLRRLSDALAVSEKRRTWNYTVRVGSCYRRHVPDTEKECGFVLKGKYMLDRVTEPKQRETWQYQSDPTHLGLSWPGRTPHSGGYACDIILQDSRGTDCFDWRAGVEGAQSCSIEQKLASSMMDEEATSAAVGAKRLNYEAWHYEWGPSASGCQAPGCANDHWPPAGHP